MRAFLFSIFLIAIAAAASLPAAPVDEKTMTFEGRWRTTNRKLDGVMTAVVTDQGAERWQGRFFGVWQGVRFDYVVEFTGPDSALKGTASIDGAYYEWTGSLDRQSPGRFQGTFTGSRYNGSFDMKTKPGS
jgi:hypothetical protein